MTAELTRGARKFEALEWPDFTDEDVEDWTRCALAVDGKPSKYRPFRNGLRRLIAFVVPSVSSPHANPIDRTYRQSFLGKFVVSAAWFGLAACVFVAISGFTGAMTSDDRSKQAMAPLSIVVAAVIAICVGLCCAAGRDRKSAQSRSRRSRCSTRARQAWSIPGMQ